MKRETFADAMGISAKTSSFGMLVGSMTYYGLVDTGGGQIRLTELAEKIVFGEEDEKRRQKEAAVRKVLLFADIYDRFGANPTDEQIRIFLREKANVEISEANELAGVVGKLLKKNLTYLTPRTGGGGGDIKTPIRQPDLGGVSGWALSTDTYGELRIVDELSADYAINVLMKFKERLQPKSLGDTKLKDLRFATPEEAGFPAPKEDEKKE